MHVDDFFRAENFAIEAGDAMLAEFDDWQQLCLGESCYFGVDWGFRYKRYLGHVDDIGRADDVADAATGAAGQIDGFYHEVNSVTAMG